MTSRPYNPARAYLGAVALALGCIGLFLFVVGVPLSFLGAHIFGGPWQFWGPSQVITAAQREAVVAEEFQWILLHRLVPLFLTSLALVGYGFCEAYKEQESKS